MSIHGVRVQLNLEILMAKKAKKSAKAATKKTAKKTSKKKK